MQSTNWQSTQHSTRASSLLEHGSKSDFAQYEFEANGKRNGTLRSKIFLEQKSSSAV